MHIYDQHTPVSPDLFLYGPSRLGAALRGSVLNRGENGSDPSQLLLPDGLDIPARASHLTHPVVGECGDNDSAGKASHNARAQRPNHIRAVQTADEDADERGHDRDHRANYPSEPCSIAQSEVGHGGRSTGLLKSPKGGV